MLYAAIRTYSIMPQFLEEVMQHIVGGFLPIISEAPDYVAYYAIRVGTNEVITINIFDTQAGPSSAFVEIPISPARGYR
jgi:hypothetical protein